MGVIHHLASQHLRRATGRVSAIRACTRTHRSTYLSKLAERFVQVSLRDFQAHTGHMQIVSWILFSVIPSRRSRMRLLVSQYATNRLTDRAELTCYGCHLGAGAIENALARDGEACRLREEMAIVRRSSQTLL